MHHHVSAFLCILFLQRESGGFIRLSEDSVSPQVLTGGQEATSLHCSEQVADEAAKSEYSRRR